MKLSGAVTLIIGIIALAAYVYFPERLNERATQALVDQGLAIARMTAYSVAPALYFEDPVAAQEVLDGAVRFPEVLHIDVLDRTGQTVAEKGKHTIVAAGDERHLTVPVDHGGRPMGSVVLGLSLTGLREEIQRARSRMALVSLILFACGIVIASVIGGLFTRPLRRMVEVANEIGRGNLSCRMPATSRDEIGRLAAAFNGMLDRVESAREELNEANRNLERRVEERTVELQQEIFERELAERALRDSEARLRQTQKLEAVGRLAAGIAHEINTPTQFVSDSVSFVREAAGELFRLIEEFQTLARAVQDGADGANMAAQVLKTAEQTDLPYLTENIPAALNSAQEGLDRIAAIVHSMKEFAHPDRREMAPIDLNHSIQSTLTIARNEYKYVADVETDLEPLPPVTCFAGEVNQAILNIVVNAAHAIAETVDGTDTRGTIRVTSRRDGDDVVIRISDTGTGIPEAIRAQVFDPFFTTKEVGHGTGQGLFLARSVIVEGHGGTVDFDTKEGEGTTFILRLPIEGKRRVEEEIPA